MMSIFHRNSSLIFVNEVQIYLQNSLKSTWHFLIIWLKFLYLLVKIFISLDKNFFIGVNMKLFFTALLLFANLFPQTPQVVIDNLGNSAPLYYFHQRKVTLTSTNQVMITWTDKLSQGGQVVYSIYDDAFQSWSPAIAISNASYTALQSALASDANGNVHASWQQRSSSSTKNEIYYSKFNGSSWTTPIKISLQPNTTPCEEATIEVDSKGTIWIVYNTDGASAPNEFVFARKSSDGGNTWSATLDTLSSGGEIGSSIETARTSLASGTNGKLVAIWDNSLDGKSSRREVFVNQYDGTKWLGQKLISDPSAADRDHSRYTTIAMDSENNIYAIYISSIISAGDPRPRRILLHKKNWSADWSNETSVIHTDSTYGQHSLSALMDGNNILHLAFRQDTREDTLYLQDEIAYTYSKNLGSSWAKPIVISRKNRDAGYVTIANRVNSLGGINLFWRESRDEFKNDQDTTSLVYAKIAYSFLTTAKENVVPENYLVLKNYPNPFNNETILNFQIPKSGKTTLKIFDLLGKEIETLLNEDKKMGNYSIKFNANKISSGLYFAQLKVDGKTILHKMILLK